MRMTMLLLPPELLGLLVFGGGFALLLGARKLATSLFVAALAMAFLPVLLAPLFNSLPEPLLLLVLVVMGIGIVFAVLRWLSDATIGRNATDNMVGILAADAVRGTARGVFGLVGLLIRGVWRLLSLPFR